MKQPQKITGIILAAGASARMGRTKQLLPFRGQTILECVVDSALASCLHRIVVVLGYEYEALEPLLAKKDVTVIHNRHYEKGQSSSTKVGLQALTEKIDAALFLLGDQPLVTPEIINLIILSELDRLATDAVARVGQHRDVVPFGLVVTVRYGNPDTGRISVAILRSGVIAGVEVQRQHVVNVGRWLVRIHGERVVFLQYPAEPINRVAVVVHDVQVKIRSIRRGGRQKTKHQQAKVAHKCRCLRSTDIHFRLSQNAATRRDVKSFCSAPGFAFCLAPGSDEDR